MGIEALKLAPKGALRRLGQRLFPKAPPMSYEENEALLAKMKRLGIPLGLEGGFNPLWVMTIFIDGVIETLGFNKPEYMPKYEKPSVPPPRPPEEYDTALGLANLFNDIMAEVFKPWWKQTSD